VPTIKACARAVLPRGIRNWLRSPAKSIVWSYQEAQYLFGRTERIEIRPGWRIRCHPLVYSHSYRAQLEDPAQTAEFDSFLSHCTEGMILYDIGAHFGLFSLAALHFGGVDALAVAVDPSPVAVRTMRIQSRLNAAGNRLRILRACVSDRVGFEDMVSVGVLANGYFVSPEKDHGPTETTRVPATTIDHMAHQIGLIPTHLKIDVEGSEAKVLRGAERLLTGSRPPILFLELHNQIISDRGGDSNCVLEYLAARNYTFRSVVSRERVTRDVLRGEPTSRLVASN
jgi:FkbM family methyltransferase